MELAKKIEAILFWKSEPLTIAELMRMCGASSAEIKQALKELEGLLSGHGIALVRTDNEVALATSADSHELIERLRKDELSKDLGKAAFETLAVVAYKAPVSRREIEYVRGVNSTSILRTLLIRGLIERVADERDERVFLYQPTVELYALLGIRGSGELPEFEAFRRELEAATVSAEKEAVSVEGIKEGEGKEPLNTSMP